MLANRDLGLLDDRADGGPQALPEAERRRRERGASSPVSTNWINGTARTVSLLDLEPDVGRGIDPRDWKAARQATQTIVIPIGRGECELPADGAAAGNTIGLIVNEGVIIREIALGEHVAFELLTPGDVLLLPADGPDGLDLDAPATVTALNRAELIVLSTRFTQAAGRWPSLLANLHRRLEAQRRRLALQSLAAHLPRAEDRLLLTLWILAAACGRVTSQGIDLPISLSHEALGRLAAARRPTITIALSALEKAGCVERSPSGHLTLGSAARRKVQELTRTSMSRSPIGPRVALHQAAK